MTIDVIRLASEANIDLELHVSIGREPVWIATQDELERFTTMVVEECAKVCYELEAPSSCVGVEKPLWDVATMAAGDAILEIFKVKP